MKKLGELLKDEGRSQLWLRKQLIEKGLNRDVSQISRWCTGDTEPTDEYICAIIADILGLPKETITNCFTRFRKTETEGLKF